jgi:hypothetical protein
MAIKKRNPILMINKYTWNHILSFRPTHPIAKLLEPKITMNKVVAKMKEHQTSPCPYIVNCRRNTAPFTPWYFYDFKPQDPSLKPDLLSLLRDTPEAPPLDLPVYKTFCMSGLPAYPPHRRPCPTRYTTRGLI